MAAAKHVLLCLAVLLWLNKDGAAQPLPEDLFEWLQIMPEQESLLNLKNFIQWPEEEADVFEANDVPNVDDVCSMFECRREERQVMKRLSQGDEGVTLAFIKWLAMHHSNGVALAVKNARSLAHKSQDKFDINSLVLVSHVSDVKEMLIDFISHRTGPVTRPAMYDFLAWISQEAKNSDDKMGELWEDIHKAATAFKTTLETAVKLDTQSLPAPFDLMEAHTATILHAALGSITSENLKVVLSRRKEGLNVLHRAAHLSATAHVKVILWHTKRLDEAWQADFLKSRVQAPTHMQQVVGMTAQEVAVFQHACDTAQVLAAGDSTLKCPASTIHSVKAAKDVKLVPLAGIEDWPATVAEQSLLPENDCG